MSLYDLNSGIELSLNKGKESLNEFLSFRCIFHQVNPSAPTVIIHNAKKILVTSKSGDREGTPDVTMHKF